MYGREDATKLPQSVGFLQQFLSINLNTNLLYKTYVL